jgi:hypothetical protein
MQMLMLTQQTVVAQVEERWTAVPFILQVLLQMCLDFLEVLAVLVLERLQLLQVLVAQHTLQAVAVGQ